MSKEGSQGTRQIFLLLNIHQLYDYFFQGYETYSSSSKEKLTVKQSELPQTEEKPKKRKRVKNVMKKTGKTVKQCFVPGKGRKELSDTAASSLVALVEQDDEVQSLGVPAPRLSNDSRHTTATLDSGWSSDEGETTVDEDSYVTTVAQVRARIRLKNKYISYIHHLKAFGITCYFDLKTQNLEPCPHQVCN